MIIPSCCPLFLIFLARTWKKHVCSFLSPGCFSSCLILPELQQTIYLILIYFFTVSRSWWFWLPTRIPFCSVQLNTLAAWVFGMSVKLCTGSLSTGESVEQNLCGKWLSRLSSAYHQSFHHLSTRKLFLFEIFKSHFLYRLALSCRFTN